MNHSVGKLSKSVGLQNTSSTLKSSLRIPVASRQTLRLSASQADVSMSNTQEGITLPMRHDEKKRAVKYYEKCFDCRGVPQRGEKINSERFRAQFRNAWMNAREKKRKRSPGILFIFSHLRALLESPWDPSSVTKRRPERILFTVADSWTTRISHDCESWIASPDTWKKVKWRKFIFSWQKIEVERSVSYLKIASSFRSYKFENNRADSKINHKISFCIPHI